MEIARAETTAPAIRKMCAPRPPVRGRRGVAAFSLVKAFEKEYWRALGLMAKLRLVVSSRYPAGARFSTRE